jgi:hypothetical protein
MLAKSVKRFHDPATHADKPREFGGLGRGGVQRVYSREVIADGIAGLEKTKLR